MKVFVRIVLVAILLVPSLVRAETTVVEIDDRFRDVAGLSDEVRDAITHLVVEETIQGYGDATFRPQASVSVKEFIKLIIAPVLRAKIAASLLTETPDSEEAINALDALRQGSLEDIIASGVRFGITAGSNSALPITRKSAVFVIGKAYNLDENQSGASLRFVDISSADTVFISYLARLTEEGIISGRTETEFVPEGTLTRAEAAKIAYLSRTKLLRPSGSSVSAEESDDTEEGVRISSSSIRIVQVAPRSLVGGESAIVIFTVSNSRGNPISGLSFGDDLLARVVRGQATITNQEELGNGVYVLEISTLVSAPIGPLCVDITLLRGKPETASTCGENTISRDEPSPLSRLIPASIEQGGEASIVVTPQTHSGDPVSGLTLRAQLVRGAGEITQQMTENPPGTGVYIGRFEAADVPSNVEIRVYNDSGSSGTYATLTATVH